MSRPERKVQRTETFGFVRVEYFSTRYTRFVSAERSRTLLSIPQVPQHLWDDGTIRKLAELLGDSDVLMLQSHYRNGVKCDLEPVGRVEECIKFILDSDLSAVSKFIYLVALFSTPAPITTEILAEIFAKQPVPMKAIEVIAEAKTATLSDLMEGALFTNFQRINIRQRTVESYRRASLTTAFLSSSVSTTFGEFMKKHENEHYIPRWNPMRYDDVYYTPINPTFLNDLNPVEFMDYVRNFGSRVPSELRRWSQKRFLEGVLTNYKAQHKGKTTNLMGSPDWSNVYSHLTAEEAAEFRAFGLEKNGLFDNFRGADNKTAALIAFYFTEGGPEKLRQLINHIHKNLNDANSGLVRYKPIINLNWRNPYSDTTKSRVKLLPYIRAVTDPERKDLPLEFALLTL